MTNLPSALHEAQITKNTLAFLARFAGPKSGRKRKRRTGQRREGLATPSQLANAAIRGGPPRRLPLSPQRAEFYLILRWRGAFFLFQGCGFPAVCLVSTELELLISPFPHTFGLRSASVMRLFHLGLLRDRALWPREMFL